MSRITSPVSNDPPWLSMYPATPIWQHQAIALLLLTVFSFIIAFLPIISLYHLHRKRKRLLRDDATFRRHFRSSDSARQELAETIVTETIAFPNSVLRLLRSFDAGTLLALFFLILLPQLRSTFEHFVQLHVTQTVSRKILPGENVLRNLTAFQADHEDAPEYSERRAPGTEASSQTTTEEFENISAALLSRFNSPIPLVELVLCLAFFALHFLEEFIQICFRYRKYFWACNSSVLYSSSRDQCPLTALDYRISKTKRFLIDCSRKTSSTIEQQQHPQQHPRPSSQNHQFVSMSRPPKIGLFNTRPMPHYQVSTPTYENGEDDKGQNVSDPEMIDIEDVCIGSMNTGPNNRLESIAEVNNEHEDNDSQNILNHKPLRRNNSGQQNSSQDSLISENSSIHLPSYYWDTGQRSSKAQVYAGSDDNDDCDEDNDDERDKNEIIMNRIHPQRQPFNQTTHFQNNPTSGDACAQQCLHTAASLALLHQCCDHSFVAAHQPPYCPNNHQLNSGEYSLNSYSAICWQCHAQQVLETFCRQNQPEHGNVSCVSSCRLNGHNILAQQSSPNIFTKIFLPFTTVATSTPAIYLCEGALIALQPNLSLFWLSLAVVLLHKAILGLSVTLELYEKTTGRQKNWPNSTAALYTLLPLSGFLLVCLLNGYFVLKDQLPAEDSFTVFSLAGSVHNITSSSANVQTPSVNLQRLLIVKIIILALCSGASLHLVLLVVQRSWNAFQSSEPRIRVNKALSTTVHTNTSNSDAPTRTGSTNTGKRTAIHGITASGLEEDDGSNVNDLELITDPPRFSIVHHFTMYTGFIVVLLAVAFFNITSKAVKT